MKVTYTKEQSEFIKKFTQVVTKDGKTYYHIPYWFSEIEPNVFEELSLDREIPEDLKNHLEELIK